MSDMKKKKKNLSNAFIYTHLFYLSRRVMFTLEVFKYGPKAWRRMSIEVLNIEFVRQPKHFEISVKCFLTNGNRHLISQFESPV